MYNALLLSAALLAGQADESRSRPVEVMPALVVTGEATVQQVSASSTSSAGVCCSSGSCCSPVLGCFRHGCDTGCGHGCARGCGDCKVTCFKPWKCEDLEMKPAECGKRCCGCLGFFFCPKEEENGNGKDEKNGEKKNGEKKNGEKKNGNGEEEKEEEEADLNPLMQAIKCHCPMLFEDLDCCKTKLYGWLQMGFATNYSRPPNNLIFGVNFNNRANDFMLNQAYFVLEKTIDLDKRANEFQVGFRVDFFGGHDAPYFENPNLGMWPNLTGNKLGTPASNEFGISMPQFWVEAHLPVLTERGVDVRVGRFYTMMGYELYPAPQQDFYSHSYEIIYGTPFTHFGVWTITHLGDTVDFHNCLIRGSETTFHDYNDSLEYMGGFTWTSCDKRNILAVNGIFGPEPSATNIGQNHDWRSVITAYYTRKFGSHDQWRFVTGGNVGWQPGATAIPNGAGDFQAADWYGYSSYLFYTIDPRLIVGARGEWFRDDDGFRTGFADSYWEITLGLTWKPFQNLRVRPEVRWDWADGTTPYNAGTKSSQFSTSIDLVWEF